MLHMLRIRFHRKQQQKSRMARHQIKILHITRVRDHIPVKIVLKLSDTVNIHPRCPPVLEQLLLIMHPMLSEQLHRIIRVDAPLLDRDCRIPQLLHLRLYL